MTNNTENIIYSRADIEKYLQGKMSFEAMHQLELAALKDPFLADAIEGYTNANATTSSKHLSQLETQILGNSSNAKVVIMQQKNNFNLLKIVASIIVVVGIGYITTIVFKVNNKQTIAEQIVTNPSARQNKGAADTSADNVTQKKDETIATKELDKKLQQQNSVVQSGNVKSKVDADGDGVTEQFDLESKTIAKPSSTISTTNAEVKIDNSIAANKTTEPTKEKLTSIGSLAKDDAKSIAFDKQNVVALAPIKMQTDTSYKAVVATTFGAKRKNEITAKALKLTKEDSLTIPINGWEDFNTYVKNNASNISAKDTIKSNFTITNSRVGGEVVDLEFLVDEAGNPEKIKVTNSTNIENNAKAIELLKNGPKWTNTNNGKKQKGKVSIKF